MRAALICLFSLWLAPAVAQAPEIYQTVRALQELQTGMAFGKVRARDDQANVVADIGRQISAAPESVWADQRNARAAIIWLLSGGSAHVMRRTLLARNWPAIEREIALGALAFVEGRATQAREILLKFDPGRMDPALGGQLALVQAALVLPESHDRAIHALALARLIAPGTLVEETALRRQISLVGETSDAASFANLSRQYSRRFSGSLYAQDFRHAFADTFTRIGISAGNEQVAQLAPILDGFDADERCRLAILIARASLIEGAWHSAVTFAERVMRAPVGDSCDGSRARLYFAAARISHPDHASDVMTLEMLDPSRLQEEDRALRKASLAYAYLVTRWPEPVPPEVGADGSSPASLSAAEKALRESEILLQGQRK